MYVKVQHKMNKRTAADDTFIAIFSPELKRKYEEAKQKGVTDQTFAESIGVERPQLDRYLDGKSMPSVRTVAFAYREYNIAIPYQGISLQSALPKSRKTRPPVPGQMVLPLTIETDKAKARIDFKLVPISPRKVELRLTVKSAS
jgi:transcriptional regulator with XRE-family HTH domain